MSNDPHSQEPHGGHATVGLYNLIALILFVVTVLEVGILYPPLSSLPDAIKITLLVGMSVAKFGAVVAFFMHLYYDHPICAGLFALGLGIAIGTMVALIHILPRPENPLQARPKDEIHKEDPKVSLLRPALVLVGVRADYNFSAAA